MSREVKDLLVKYYELMDNPKRDRKLASYPALPEEVMFLYGLIMREEPDVIFESGTAVGWSASWMALASDATVFTYDPVDRPKLFKGSYIFTNTQFKDVYFRIEYLTGHKKLFFIDGDHSTEGFREDFDAIEFFLEPGDIIVLHDTKGELGVYRGLKRIKRHHPDWRYESINTKNGMEVITCL